MPILTVAPLQRGRRALIVGNGPSCGTVPWPRAWRYVAETRGSWADLFLMNRTALGPTRPRYAVAVGDEILDEYRRAGLYRRCRIVTNPPWKHVGNAFDPTPYGKILSAPTTLFAPDAWPSHASGPLATWAAAALGYEEILLYGLDGSAGPPQPKDDWEHRARTWEHWLRAWRGARAGNELPCQRLVRLWPEHAALPIEQDPLGEALAEVVVVPAC